MYIWFLVVELSNQSLLNVLERTVLYFDFTLLYNYKHECIILICHLVFFGCCFFTAELWFTLNPLCLWILTHALVIHIKTCQLCIIQTDLENCIVVWENGFESASDSVFVISAFWFLLLYWPFGNMCYKAFERNMALRSLGLQARRKVKTASMKITHAQNTPALLSMPMYTYLYIHAHRHISIHAVNW